MPEPLSAPRRAEAAVSTGTNTSRSTGRADARPLREQIFEGLNEEQARAVAAVRGPVVILAGAGSGKTTTITRRLANQIVSGEFAPHNLLAVTFTRKAAAELKERLARLGVAGVPASTFHAAAKRQVEGLTGREFDILESATRLLFAIRDRLPQQYRQQNVKDWENEIGRAKSNRVRPETYLDELGEHLPPLPGELMQRVYAEYEREMRAVHKVDFADLIELAIQMFETDAAALAQFRERYKAVTVDEFQDVNLLQQTLLDLWLGGLEGLGERLSGV